MVKLRVDFDFPVGFVKFCVYIYIFDIFFFLFLKKKI
jgi:hypothetical protein